MSGASSDGNDERAPPDPLAAARRMARAELPRRFYKTATVEPSEGGGFALLLDGRRAKTPAKRPLVVSHRFVAEALAAEWRAQGERLNPSAMPLSRIVNAAIDHVASAMEAVARDIVKYAGSDLLSYRAEAPPSLVDRQEAIWSPLVAWAEEALGAPLILAVGVVPVAQTPAALRAIGSVVSGFDPLKLAALHAATTLTGSAILALALARGRLSAEAAWEAAHLDEDWQAAKWGIDEAAAARRALRWREMQAAALVLAA